jgi:DNA-binding GntR family transcriptional regulator
MGTRRKHSERAYRALKRRILDNELPAGTVMLEQEIAEMLDMSRTPVHEALLRLANEGMLEVRPRHGMRVLPVSAADMEEIYQILTALESEAAAVVARNGLTDEQVQGLEKVVGEMDRALAEDDLTAWAHADERFHFLLVSFCENQRLITLVNTYLDQSHRVRMLTLRLRPRPTTSNKDHAAVVAAIKARDPQQARRIHSEHRTRSGQMLIRLLKEHGLTQL